MHHVQGAIRRKLPSLILLFVLCALVLVFAPNSGGLAITAIVCGVLALALGVLAFLPLGARRAAQHQPHPVQPPAPGPAGQQGLSGPVQGGPPPGPPAPPAAG